MTSNLCNRNIESKMEALSLHLCFQIEGNPIRNQELWKKLMTVPSICIATAGSPTCVDAADGDKLLVAIGTDSSHVAMHVHSEGFVTLDVQYRKTRTEAVFESKVIEEKIKKVFAETCQYTRSLPVPIKRGQICPYFNHCDSTLFESGPLQLVFEKDSQWQNIKIYKTRDFGNMLILDGELMLAEADDIYTKTLMGSERNVYTDKTVLILGGGDGGLLHEILKFAPKHVLMVEIDIEVIKACREHMKGACGKSMDELVGVNYEIRIDNCLDVLMECMDTGRKFDYVINDLSEYVLNTDGKWYSLGQTFNFKTSAKILEYSMTILDSNGKYLSRGDGVSATEALSSFIQDIQSNGLKYQEYIVDVPSFNEKYCLFEVCKPN